MKNCVRNKKGNRIKNSFIKKKEKMSKKKKKKTKINERHIKLHRNFS